MAQTLTFGENSNDVMIISSETYNANGELHLIGKWNNVILDETLPAISGPRVLMFSVDRFNFFWCSLRILMT